MRLQVMLFVGNGAFTDQFVSGQVAVDQAAIGAGGGVQVIGTVEEPIAFGDVSTLGYCVLQNLDATNAVTYGPASGGVMIPLGKLKPREVAMLRLNPGVVLRAQASVAAVKLLVKVFED